VRSHIIRLVYISAARSNAKNKHSTYLKHSPTTRHPHNSSRNARSRTVRICACMRRPSRCVEHSVYPQCHCNASRVRRVRVLARTAFSCPASLTEQVLRSLLRLSRRAPATPLVAPCARLIAAALIRRRKDAYVRLPTPSLVFSFFLDLLSSIQSCLKSARGAVLRAQPSHQNVTRHPFPRKIPFRRAWQ
jgi:hypothetical protein